MLLKALEVFVLPYAPLLAAKTSRPSDIHFAACGSVQFGQDRAELGLSLSEFRRFEL